MTDDTHDADLINIIGDIDNIKTNLENYFKQKNIIFENSSLLPEEKIAKVKIPAYNSNPSEELILEKNKNIQLNINLKTKIDLTTNKDILNTDDIDSFLITSKFINKYLIGILINKDDENKEIGLKCTNLIITPSKPVDGYIQYEPIRNINTNLSNLNLDSIKIIFNNKEITNKDIKCVFILKQIIEVFTILNKSQFNHGKLTAHNILIDIDNDYIPHTEIESPTTNFKIKILPYHGSSITHNNIRYLSELSPIGNIFENEEINKFYKQKQIKRTVVKDKIEDVEKNTVKDTIKDIKIFKNTLRHFPKPFYFSIEFYILIISIMLSNTNNDNYFFTFFRKYYFHLLFNYNLTDNDITSNANEFVKSSIEYRIIRSIKKNKTSKNTIDIPIQILEGVEFKKNILKLFDEFTNVIINKLDENEDKIQIPIPRIIHENLKPGDAVNENEIPNKLLVFAKTNIKDDYLNKYFKNPLNLNFNSLKFYDKNKMNDVHIGVFKNETLFNKLIEKFNSPKNPENIYKSEISTKNNIGLIDNNILLTIQGIFPINKTIKFSNGKIYTVIDAKWSIKNWVKLPKNIINIETIQKQLKKQETPQHERIYKIPEQLVYDELPSIPIDEIPYDSNPSLNIETSEAIVLEFPTTSKEVKKKAPPPPPVPPVQEQIFLKNKSVDQTYFPKVYFPKIIFPKVINDNTDISFVDYIYSDMLSSIANPDEMKFLKNKYNPKFDTDNVFDTDINFTNLNSENAKDKEIVNQKIKAIIDEQIKKNIPTLFNDNTIANKSFQFNAYLNSIYSNIEKYSANEKYSTNEKYSASEMKIFIAKEIIFLKLCFYYHHFSEYYEYEYSESIKKITKLATKKPDLLENANNIELIKIEYEKMYYDKLNYIMSKIIYNCYLFKFHLFLETNILKLADKSNIITRAKIENVTALLLSRKKNINEEEYNYILKVKKEAHFTTVKLLNEYEEFYHKNRELKEFISNDLMMRQRNENNVSVNILNTIKYSDTSVDDSLINSNITGNMFYCLFEIFKKKDKSEDGEEKSESSEEKSESSEEKSESENSTLPEDDEGKFNYVSEKIFSSEQFQIEVYEWVKKIKESSFLDNQKEYVEELLSEKYVGIHKYQSIIPQVYISNLSQFIKYINTNDIYNVSNVIIQYFKDHFKLFQYIGPRLVNVISKIYQCVFYQYDSNRYDTKLKPLNPITELYENHLIFKINEKKNNTEQENNTELIYTFLQYNDKFLMNCDQLPEEIKVFEYCYIPWQNLTAKALEKRETQVQPSAPPRPPTDISSSSTPSSRSRSSTVISSLTQPSTDSLQPDSSTVISLETINTDDNSTVQLSDRSREISSEILGDDSVNLSQDGGVGPKINTKQNKKVYGIVVELILYEGKNPSLIEKQQYKCNNSFENLKKEYCEVFGFGCDNKPTTTAKNKKIKNSRTFKLRWNK